jgi:hypothetical protein
MAAINFRTTGFTDAVSESPSCAVAVPLANSSKSVSFFIGHGLLQGTKVGRKHGGKTAFAELPPWCVSLSYAA